MGTSPSKDLLFPSPAAVWALGPSSAHELITAFAALLLASIRRWSPQNLRAPASSFLSRGMGYAVPGSVLAPFGLMLFGGAAGDQAL